MTRLLVFLALVLFIGACDPNKPQPIASSERVDSNPAAQQLAILDKRQPVPLVPMMADHQKQNMRDHLAAIQEIVGALATRDFAAVRQSASRIGSSPQAEQMCNHMGAGANGFTEKGLHFHRTADRIIESAQAEDLDATLLAVSETLEACNSCHATFRQDVVDEATWGKATQSRVPSKASQSGQ